MRRIARAVQLFAGALVLVGAGLMLFGSVGLGAKVALGAAVVCGGLETNVRIAERNRYRAQRVLSDDPPERPRWRPAWLGPTQLGAVTWAGVAVYLVAFGLR